jgi:hypothetical protein
MQLKWGAPPACGVARLAEHIGSPLRPQTIWLGRKIGKPTGGGARWDTRGRVCSPTVGFSILRITFYFLFLLRPRLYADTRT